MATTPTDVRVESTSLSTATVRWTHASGNSVVVYRSLDGVTYAITGDPVALGTNEFTDTELSSATKYWYKVSDDVGATFSSVVTVVVQSCPGSPAQSTDIALPRAGNEVTPDNFNDLARRVETGLTRFTSTDGRVCVACISDGAVVLDCINYDGCDEVEITVDQDINSISLPNCDNAIININFLIPPNTTRGIGGWPRGIGFTGDEAHTSPVSGGSTGKAINEYVDRSLNVNSKSGKSKNGTSTQGSASGGLTKNTNSGTCVPGANGELTIKSSNANNSLACSGAKSLTLIACGGRGPYTWSNTGSVVRSGSSGSSITITPPVNSGSAVAGSAYVKRFWQCDVCTAGACTDVQALSHTAYKCDDTEFHACTSDAHAHCSVALSPGSATCMEGSSSCLPVCGPACDAPVSNTCDDRTAPMIAAGCNPCGIQAGATVSVTDSLGTVATVILRA